MRYASAVALSLVALVTVVASVTLSQRVSKSDAVERQQQTAYVMAMCTVPDQSTAQAIASALVSERVVACVNTVSSVKSTYRWQGNVVHDSELLLIMKTRSSLVGTLQKRLTELHPYDVPELIVHPISGGNAAYLQWLHDSTDDSTQ